MKWLIVAAIFLSSACAHARDTDRNAEAAALAALNAVDPAAGLRLTFGTKVDLRTQRIFLALRPPAAITGDDALVHLPANVLRVDSFAVAEDRATFLARKGPVPRAVPGRLLNACGTGYSIELHRRNGSWVLDGMTLQFC